MDYEREELTPAHVYSLLVAVLHLTGPIKIEKKIYQDSLTKVLAVDIDSSKDSVIVAAMEDNDENQNTE